MKKIALTSLLAVVAASAAHAGVNVLDGNPLYMPQKGHFYSETSLSSGTNTTTAVELGEEFWFALTDRLAFSVATSISENDWFEGSSWNGMAFDAKYRLIGNGAWKMDFVGGFSLNPMWADHRPTMSASDTTYTWIGGIRGGYVNGDWTIAAHANFIYRNNEMFNWANGDNGDVLWPNGEPWMNHILNLGVAGHWTMSDSWSALVTADYYKSFDHYSDVESYGRWDVTAGLNYNIDTTKYVGVYVSKEVQHEGAGSWVVEDGFGFGAKFGIDF